MIDQEEQENIEQVENTEANTQEEENVSLQQPQDQTQDVVEEESAPEATSSAPEATSSAPQLTPLQQYDIEHREYLNKKRQESEALLQQTCEQATSYLENFHEDYEKKKQLAKEKNREEEKLFLENKQNAADWVAVADMCNFSEAHTRDVSRMRQVMLRLRDRTMKGSGESTTSSSSSSSSSADAVSAEAPAANKVEESA